MLALAPESTPHPTDEGGGGGVGSGCGGGGGGCSDNVGSENSRILPLPPAARSFLSHIPKIEAFVEGAEKGARPFVPPAYRSFADHFEEMFGEKNELSPSQQRSDAQAAPERVADLEPEPELVPEPEPLLDPEPIVDVNAINMEATDDPISYSQYPLKSVTRYPPWCCCASWLY